MNRERSKFFLLTYQYLAGACDTATGILLICAPEWTLALMGVTHGAFSPAAASFVGIFVLAVGIAYLYATRVPMDAANAPRWQTIWGLTALIRSLVSLFLFWQIGTKEMESAWLTVAFTDGALAVVQWVGLENGWLRFDSAK